MDKRRLQLLEKLAQLYAWSSDECNTIRDLALKSPSDFNEKLGLIEHWLLKSEPDNPNPAAKQALDETCNTIYEIALFLDPVRNLMLSEPLFSKAIAHQVGACASFADVTPHPDPAIMLYSQDALFRRALDLTLKQFTQTAEDTFRDCLSVLISIYLFYPDVLESLYILAENFNWAEITQEIQFTIEVSGTISSIESLPAAAKYIVSQIELQREKTKNKIENELPENVSSGVEVGDISSLPPVHDLLFGSAGITIIQREEILIFKKLIETTPELHDLFSQSAWGNYSAVRKSNEIAKKIIAQKYIPEDAYRQALDSIQIRIEAAQHYVELRQYAKFNALNYAWPELASELLGNQSRFSAFESRMLDLETLQDEAKGQGELVKLLQRYKDNDQLAHFLQLRPYFGGLKLYKAKEMFNLSESLPKVEVGKLQPEKTQQKPFEAIQSSLEKPQETAGDVLFELYKNIHIDISVTTAESSQSDDTSYLVELYQSDSNQRISSKVSISNQTIHSLRNEIYNLYRYSQVRSPVEGTEAARLPVAQSTQRTKLLSSMIKELGARLYSIFFDSEVSAYLNRVLLKSSKTRFVLQIKDPLLWILPWESLYVPELRLAIALVSKYSIVRFLPGAGLTPKPWGAKLKILGIYSNPVNFSPINLEEEEKALEDVFSKAQSVEIKQIQHVTLDEFLHQIRVFQPNIIHFGGHGGFNQDTGEGSLFFEQPDGKAVQVHASQFSDWIVGTNVSLVLLNACDTGTSDVNDAVTSLAGSLVASGVPVAIATTRAIHDLQSIIFVREFYQALVDGYTVEASMAEARKRVNGEEWDWSVFALFTNTLNLERYKLMNEQK